MDEKCARFFVVLGKDVCTLPLMKCPFLLLSYVYIFPEGPGVGIASSKASSLDD